METCESIGLLKVDFLGLSTLTQLRRACELIEQYHGIRYDMSSIPYRPTGDPEIDRKLRETFAMIGRGETIGVFQIESSGMQEMLRGMRPTRFEHIVAAVSLYRPGPMEYIPEFNDRMHGRKEIHYHHERLRPILEETYGIITYQEQIMQIASELFGYSLGDADLMRRAVSKKKKEDLLKHREIFLANGPKYGVDAEAADKIFADIEFFANYGFNKSHAADYAVITVQSAYLKCHYPAEYMAALLSVYFDDATKVTTFLTECRRLGIPILPPDVNHSALDFAIQVDDQGRRGIRFGLAAVKNAGVGALKHIIEARDQGGHFRDLQDFCERVDLRLVGKRAVESLIKVGALEAFGKRAQLIAALDRMMSFSAEYWRAREIGQMSMFGGVSDIALSDDLLANLPQTEEVSERAMLDWEKELLGFYVSRHPIEPVLHIIQSGGFDTTATLREAGPERADKPVRLIGLIAGIRKLPTRSHDMMAIVTIEDHYSTIDVVFFPRVWQKLEDRIAEGAVLLFSGKLDLSRGDPQVIGENVTDEFEMMTADTTALPVALSAQALAWLPAEEDDLPPELGVWQPAGSEAAAPPANGQSYGGDGANGGAPYAGANPEPPSFAELPWLTDEPLYDAPPDALPSADKPAHRRTLIVRFERSADHERDVRRFNRIYNLLTSYPGEDRFVIELVEADAAQAFEFPDTTGICAALLEALDKSKGTTYTIED